MRDRLERIERKLERMGRRIDRETKPPHVEETHAVAATDVLDRGEEYVVRVDLPGFDRESIQVRIADDTLRVSAEHAHAGEPEREKYLREERSKQKVVETLDIPADADESEATASYEDGVLTVTLPKAESEEKAATHSIEIG